MRTCKNCGQEKPLDSENFPGSMTNGKYYFRWQCRECELARNRQYYASNLDVQRARVKKYHLEVRHGLGEGGYERMLAAQGGGCAVCGATEPGGERKYFAVDHDHQHCPGKFGCSECVRGLLCGACNVGLGCFRDDIKKLESAIVYLRLVSN